MEGVSQESISGLDMSRWVLRHRNFTLKVREK